MKFCWCTINVKNMAESLKFYQEVIGLPIDRKMGASPGREIVFLGEGETKVELICGNDGQACNIGKDIAIGFEVKSLDETMAMVQEKGIAILSGPHQPNPHIRFFYVLDPDGLRIQFVENS